MSTLTSLESSRNKQKNYTNNDTTHKPAFINLTKKNMTIENEKKANFADLLLRLGSKQSTREDFKFLLEVLPPVITNYKEGEGFDAFLGGDALDIKFCNIAKRESLIYKGYCTASSGEILELILSVPAFKHYFNN